MRQTQQKNRMRGRGRKQPNPMSRSFESNGPDVKIRGNASHIAEKYTQLARDALSSGDTVMAENYLQHAEHYNRIIAAAAANSVRDGESGGLNRPQPEFGGQSMDDEDDDEGDDMRLPGERRIQDNRSFGEERIQQPRERDENRNRNDFRNDNRSRGEYRERNDNRDRTDNRDRADFRERSDGREQRVDNREQRPDNRDRSEVREPRQIPIETRPQPEVGDQPEGIRPRRDMRNRRPRPAADDTNGHAGNGAAGRDRPLVAAPAVGISSDAAKLPGSLFGVGPEPIAGPSSDE